MIPPDSARTPPRKFNWLLFSIVLSIPAVAIWITPRFTSGSMNDLGVLVATSVYGSAVSGVGCGIMLALWKGGAVGHQIVTGILFSVLCAIVSFAICCASCAVPALIGGMAR